MPTSRLAFLFAIFTCTVACGGPSPASNEPAISQTAAPASTGPVARRTANVLTMKIDGREWTADGEVFGAFHPAGYNNAILISGSRGPKDKNEQAFNLNLYNAAGSGVYAITQGNADNSVAQLANMSPEHYLYGSLMGFTMKVTLTAASGNPTVLEGTFSGEMKGNASDTIVISDGKFSYRE